MMLTAAGCAGRRRRLLSALDPAPEWIALADPAHLVYFANFYPTPFSFRSQNANALLLLLGADGSSTLFADNLQEAFLQAAHVDEKVTVDWYRGRESAPERNSVLQSAALEWFRGHGGTRGAVDHAVSIALRSAVAGTAVPDVRNISPVVHQLRRRKDPDEVALMRRSISAGEAGFAAAIGGITPGMTELQAYALIQSAATLSAGQPVVVYGDFASGPRTEEKGGPPTERVIVPGDLFLLDYSVVVHGYRGDFTNTFVIGDRGATPAQRDLEAICLEAMHAGEALLASGAEARAIDAAVRGIFTAHGEEPFPHHSGHGLGLGHPDPPYLATGSTDHLEEGDIVTLEPGAYRSGTGGMRFERNYLITAAGFELLTHHRLGLHPAPQG